MSQRTYLDRAAIFAVPDIKTEEVYIPEWGGVVRVRGLTASQRDQLESDSLQFKGRNQTINLQNMRARMVVFCVVDAEGNPLFTERDIRALGDRSARALDRIFDVATRLSGMGNSDIEELTKNSESDQSEDSSSG